MKWLTADCADVSPAANKNGQCVRDEVAMKSGSAVFGPDQGGDWEALDDSLPTFAFHENALAAVREVQTAISAYQTADDAVDWSEVVVDLPRASHGRRSSVLFRRLQTTRPRSRKSLPALDLSKSPDELLANVSIAQVIRSSDASILLLGCVARSNLFAMNALDFLADGDSEAQFLTVPGLTMREYFEIVDTLNAFTILVHRSATRSGFVYVPPDAAPGLAPASLSMQKRRSLCNSCGCPSGRQLKYLSKPGLARLYCDAAAPISIGRCVTLTASIFRLRPFLSITTPKRFSARYEA